MFPNIILVIEIIKNKLALLSFWTNLIKIFSFTTLLNILNPTTFWEFYLNLFAVSPSILTAQKLAFVLFEIKSVT